MSSQSAIARRAGFSLLMLLSLGVAGYAAVMYAFLPLGKYLHPAISAVYNTYPAAIYTHVLAAMVALLLGPFQFMPGLRARRPHMHRWMGRLYLGVGVLAGGVAGLFMSFHAFGGLPARLGFFCLAMAWLCTGGLAWLAIVSGDIAEHRRWMVRNFALTFAAVMLRLYLPSAMASGIRFELAYPFIAWLCWVPNLVVAELLFNKRAAVG